IDRSSRCVFARRRGLGVFPLAQELARSRCEEKRFNGESLATKRNQCFKVRPSAMQNQSEHQAAVNTFTRKIVSQNGERFVLETRRQPGVVKDGTSEWHRSVDPLAKQRLGTQK
ncbi:MAG: hypothetical protein WA224_00105, partial [Candidatus Acidiferrales bacterium]